MRLFAILMFCVFAVAAAGERERYVIPAQKSVGIYENKIRELNERAIFEAGLDDRLVVIAEDGQYLQVKDSQRRIGWVEKRLVTSISASARMIFDNKEVLAYIDNPTPIYIFGNDESGQTALRLDRSFQDALSVNIDRETIERSVQ